MNVSQVCLRPGEKMHRGTHPARVVMSQLFQAKGADKYPKIRRFFKIFCGWIIAYHIIPDRIIWYPIIEGSLEVKLPTIWTDEKQRWEESEKRREEERRTEKRKSQKTEDAVARKGSKVRKVANHSVFPMICGSGGSKSRLAKAAGAEPFVQMRD